MRFLLPIGIDVRRTCRGSALLVASCTVAALAPPVCAQRSVWVQTGVQPGEQMGEGVDGAGDVDADGIPDVIIGVTQHNDGNPSANGFGYAEVRSGADARLIWRLDCPVPQMGAHFGWPVCGVGDIDLDGHDDVLVAAYQIDVTGGVPLAEYGAIWVFSGKTSAILYQRFGENQADQLGIGSSGAGDVNADGYPDLLVSAAWYDGPGLIDSGRVLVVSGEWIAATSSGTTPLTPEILHELLGTESGALFGEATCGLGDLDGDGCADFAIGEPRHANLVGRCHVVSGATGFPLSVLPGNAQGDDFGGSVGGVADLNGDGVRELIVGAIQSPPGGGYVQVFSGRSLVPPFGPPVALHTFTGSASGDRLGHSVDSAGDMNRDGYEDIVAGAPNVVQCPATSGYVRVFSGKDGSTLFTYYGGSSGQPCLGDVVGWSVSGAGDVDGDGHDEIVFGAPLREGNAGAAWVFAFGYTPYPTSYAGCPGSAGIPHLRADRAPLIGQPFTPVLENLPPFGPPVLGQPYLTFALPAGAGGALVPIPPSAPQCLLWVSPLFLAVPMTNAGGTATLIPPLVIPADTALVGVTLLVNQGIVLDTGANDLGVSTSNACLGTIGTL
jgi:hypothetical protein